MKTYYFEAYCGCGLRKATSFEAEVGSMNAPKVSLATPENIAWVKAMGGYVP